MDKLLIVYCLFVNYLLFMLQESCVAEKNSYISEVDQLKGIESIDWDKVQT